MKISAIVLSSGKSQRFGRNKMLFNQDGEPVVLKTVKAFDNSHVDEIVVCVPEGQENIFKDVLKTIKKPLVFAEGGKDRHASTISGLKAASGDFVLIHDGARCFVTSELIERVIDSLDGDVGIIPVTETSDSLILEENCVSYLPREKVKSVQTPQAFNRKKLLELYEDFLGNNEDLSLFTDNGGVWKTKYPIKTIQGEVSNKKLTYPSDCKDFSFAEVKFNTTLGENGDYELTVGNGFDLHELRENRPLVLGGVKIPHEKGLFGVSDADVVLHALMDALLSSLSLPDIGHRFPPDDPAFEGADSVNLLENVLEEFRKKGAKVENVSITILAEKPRLSPFIPQMKERISALLEISHEKVGISATTTEGLGLVGREEGIACYATCLTKKLTKDNF